jgi:hypothetical protein
MSAESKIQKPAGSSPIDGTELQVAQALFDLENNVAELKKDLRVIKITAAKEVWTLLWYKWCRSTLDMAAKRSSCLSPCPC